MNEAEIIEYLQKVMDNKFIKFVLKELSRPKDIQKALGIYAGVEKPSNLKERVHAKIVSSAIERASKLFSDADTERIKDFLKDPYVRKGFSSVIRGITEYGITKPQRLFAPFMVVWDFTKQCNLKCKHCYANATPYPSPDELTLEQKLNVVDQLDEAGVAAISFSGGEPLISKDIMPVVKYAASKGFYISIATNGTLLTKEKAVGLKEAGVRYVEISIDGPTAEIHDSFRGVKGAFDRSIQGIRNAKNAGIDVGIATVATHHNLDQIPEIVKLARSLSVNRLIVFNFIPTGRGKEIVKSDLTPEERENLMKYLYDEWQKGKMQIFSTCPAYSRISLSGSKMAPTHFADVEIPAEFSSAGKALAEFIGGCGAGRIYCSIEQNGDIQPCVFLPIKVGNVIKDGFKNVWDNSEVFKILRNRDAKDYACSKCAFRYICGGCRARAYAYYGDVRAPDPGCILMKREWDKLTKSF